MARKQTINTGITRPPGLTTTDDTLTHGVQLQRIDEFENRAALPAVTELNFRDCFSACPLDRLLGLNIAPVSVERRPEGSTGAATWWIDDAFMMERERYERMTRPERPLHWNNQTSNGLAIEATPGATK